MHNITKDGTIYRTFGVLLIIVAVASGSCEPGDGAIGWESQSNAVIGGENETGYPAVGAIVFQEWFSKTSKCTATLIKDDWVLTAAHCLKDGLDGLTFSTGSNATSGPEYGIAEAIVHPRYYSNPIGSLYDIALLRLTAPVPSSDATPIPYSNVSIDSLLGETVLYVGFGSTSGTTSFLGLGLKRSVSLPIERIDLVTYSHGFDGSGLCFGDSGGPGLVEIGGQLQIVGVTSASLGCQGDSCDPCTNGSKHTRIDRFTDWMAGHVGDPFTPCDDDIDRCVCDFACGDDGLCDNALCGNDTCGDITDCIFGECADSTDGSCSTGCIDDGSIAAREELLFLVDCWAEECRNIEGSANELQCLLDYCGDAWDSCSQQVNPQTDAGVDPPDSDSESEHDTETDSDTDDDGPSAQADLGRDAEDCACNTPGFTTAGASSGFPFWWWLIMERGC